MEKVIVSGATSMLGLELVDLMLKRNLYVIALVRPKSLRISSLQNRDNIELIECELGDYGILPKQTNISGFFHLAWDTTSKRDDYEAQIKNIQYTMDAMNYAEKCECKFFLGTGSQAEYGVVNTGVKLSSLTPVNPESGYGIAKYAAGRMVINHSKAAGMMRTCWSRILSVYGNNDRRKTLISYVINQINYSEVIELSPCKQIWDYLYIRDAAEALVAIYDKGQNGKTYVIGSGTGRPLCEYLYDIQRLMNKEAKFNFGSREYGEHQPMYMVADIDEITRDTGWIPRFSFQEGIIDMFRCKEVVNG